MNGYDKIFNEIKEKFINKEKYKCDVLCKIKYKYSHWDVYETEVAVLRYDAENDAWIWCSDWWEGQEDCYLVWATYVVDIDNVILDGNRYMYMYEEE